MRIAIIGTVASSILGFRAEFIQKLISEGHVVYALAVDYTDLDRKKVCALGALPIDYNLNRSGLSPLDDILNTYKLSLILKKLELDLVFSYFVKPVIFGTLAARIARIPSCFGMLEGLGYIFTNQPGGVSFKVKLIKMVQVLLYRFSFGFLNSLIFLNEDDERDLIVKHKIKVKSVSILGGVGLNLDEYPYVKPDVSNVNFLFIGRLLAEKGINEFVQAATFVKNKYPSVEFIVLGDVDSKNPGGLSREDLSKLIKDNVINCPGHVSHVQEWIANSSVFVLPSYREGVPRSTQEAMAMGRAIITTDVPGCRDTVIDGENGFLVPPWSWRAIAEKMIYFIENKEKIVEMGEKSHKMALEKYDSKIVNCRLLSLLNIKADK